MNPNEETNNETQATEQFPVESEEMKMPENSDMPVEQVEKSAVSGPLLFSLVVLLLVILGGMYYWFSVMQTPEPAPAPVVERPTAEENNEPESTTAEAQADTMLTTSPSDEIDAIESDIEATDLDSLDAELEAIDAELEAALEEL